MRRGTQPLHASWLIEADSKSVEQEALLNLLREASTALEADFACVHLFSIPEIERGLANRTIEFLSTRGAEVFKGERRILEFAFLLSSQHIHRCIPELYWATVFGPHYVKMFGRDRLLSTPVFRVESLGTDRILLQLSAKLSDLEDHWPEVERVHSSAKAHLGQDAFFQPGAESPAGYRVPQFEL